MNEIALLPNIAPPVNQVIIFKVPILVLMFQESDVQERNNGTIYVLITQIHKSSGLFYVTFFSTNICLLKV